MASGIEKFIQSVCVQTAVYWAKGKADGFGGRTYSTPVEVACRWAIENEIVKGADGKETVSSSGILVTQDLEQEGLLWLGTLSELNATQKKNPLTIYGVQEIRAVDKIPMIKSRTVFVRKVYLSSRSNQGKSF